MKKLDVLRKEFRDKVAALRAILTKGDTEKRALTKEEQADFEKLEGEIAETRTAIEREEKVVELETRALQTAANAGAGAEDRQRFGSLGEFLMAVVRAEAPGSRRQLDPRLHQVEARAASGMSEWQPSDGGFLVQQDQLAELLKRVYDMGQISSRIRRIPSSGPANSLKINAVAETSRVNGSRWGGVQAYWQNEADLITASKPKFRQMELNLKKLAAACYATDELLQDAAALEAVITQSFTEEMNFKLEDAIVWGTGAGQPLGFMNSGALVSQAIEAGPQTTDTIVAANIVKMYARMWARSLSNAVWFVNQDCLAQLWLMTSAATAAAQPVFLPPGGLSSAPYGMLLGRPVIPVEYNSTLGDLGDITFVDLSQYLVLDKGGVQQASSMHVRFLYDEMTFRFTYRADGQSTWNAALTPYKGTNTLSPFVALAAR